MFFKWVTLLGVVLGAVATASQSQADPSKGDKPAAEPLIMAAGDHIAQGGLVRVYIRPVDAKFPEFRPIVVGFAPKSGDKYPLASYQPANGVRDGTSWFVYPESAERVWVFDGRDKLILCVHQFKVQPASIESSGNISDANKLEVVKSAPAAVRDRLPKAFMDSLKRKP